METQRVCIKNKVRRECIEILFSDLHFLLLGESLGAILFTIALWSHISSSILALWLLANLGNNGLLRHVLTWQFHQHKTLNLGFDVRAWHQRFLLTCAFAGIIWAVGASFIFLVNADIDKLLIILFMCAVLGAANVVFIPDKIGYLIFTTPIFLVTFAGLVTGGSTMYFVLGMFLLSQYLLSANLMFRASRMIIQSLAFQLKNAELLHKIILAKSKVEEVNHSLIDESETIRQVEKTLHELATHDQLTKLPNRHFLMPRIQQLIERARRNHHLVALLYVDLDYFKNVNDTLGHDIGDKLLIKAALRMQHALRAEDLIARLGGDEFCIVLDNVQDAQVAESVAQKMIDALSEPFVIDEHILNVSASIGIGLYPEHANDLTQLFQTADTALYQAKGSGRNHYVTYAAATS